jgi:adenosylcobinamide-phosphate synthase
MEFPSVDIGRALSPGLVLVLALIVEILVGDPVSRWHPVALLGSLVQYLFRAAPAGGAVRQLVYGGLAVGATVAGVTVGASLLLSAVSELSAIAGLMVGGLLLKASFSIRQLTAEALVVAGHLELGRVLDAQAALRALVGRDTSTLSPELAASAAVESLAENLSDSFVAPLLYFVIFGVPGALAYRAINTLDAQVGYHGPYEMLGKIAARLDDLANFVPARVTAGILVLACWLARANPFGAARSALRYHARTESPNAGWPMAAMAGALGVRLEKPAHYLLGDSGASCSPTTIRQAVWVVRWGAVCTSILAAPASSWFR